MAEELPGQGRARPVRRPPRCYFCLSTDTMPPFMRSARVFLLSRLFPIRWRYCRRCARHFITTGKPKTP